MRRLQTGVPPGVWRSSGSRVRLPTSTTLLMLAAIALLLLVRTRVRFSVLRHRDGNRLRYRGGRGRRRLVARRARLRALDVLHGQVPHHAVVDLEHARDLVERLAAALEDEQVVDALRLLVDLVGQPPAAPRVVAPPGTAAALDELAHARDHLVLVGVGALRVQHQKNLVPRQRPDDLPSGLPTV